MAAMPAGRHIVLIGGGARSGKSGFALSQARALGEPRLFVATATAQDEEMRQRIARHRADRGADFETVEEPTDLAGVLFRARAGVVLVDCLTLWLANLVLSGASEAVGLERVRELVTVLRAAPFHAVLVTNEVGMGLVPDTELGRRFRDLSGRAHQILARAADKVYLAVLGMVLRLKPGPVEVERVSGPEGSP